MNDLYSLSYGGDTQVVPAPCHPPEVMVNAAGLADGKQAAVKKEEIMRRIVGSKEEEDEGRPTRAVKRTGKRKVAGKPVGKKANGKLKVEKKGPSKAATRGGAVPAGKRPLQDLKGGVETRKRLPAKGAEEDEEAKEGPEGERAPPSGPRRKVIRVSQEELRPDVSNVVDADFTENGADMELDPNGEEG